jgi:hypothetical protein
MKRGQTPLTTFYYVTEIEFDPRYFEHLLRHGRFALPRDAAMT